MINLHLSIKGIKWIVVCFLVFFIGIITSEGIAISKNTQAIVNTSERGIPSTIFEWKEVQLFEKEGVYNITNENPIPFTGLSVGWIASEDFTDPSEFKVMIRTRKGEGLWTEWIDTRGAIGPNDNPSGLYWSLLYIPSDFDVHTNFEIKIKPPISVSLTFIRVSVADASSALEIFGFLEGFPEIITREVFSRPYVVPRSEWSNGQLSDTSCYSWPPQYQNATHALIHHTVTYNNPSNPAQVVYNIWNFHANDLGWGDIGYNFLIDQYGNIYQGRCNPFLNTEDVIGAHAKYYNAGSMGVALIGQFHPPEPNPPSGEPSYGALRSTENLIAWKFSQRSLDPLGKATLVDKYIYRIAGHRDVAATACPGDNLYDLLPMIRTNVQNLLTPSDNPPVVETFNVTPTSVTLGNSFNISYTVSDDIGLQQTELWRANDVDGTPDWDTPDNPIYTIVLSGQKNYSGLFIDTPSSTGIYYYGMHVVDTAGNWSVEPDPPGPIMVSVTNPTINPPTGVQATDGTYTDKIRITWNSVSGASYYHVYRATSSGGSKTPLGNWQSNTFYDDTSATPGQTYYYFIKAATSNSGSNASDYSVYNEGWRKLSPPIGVNASDGTYTDKVRITWNSVSGASYYHIYRATSSGGSKTPLGIWQSSTTYDDTSASPGQTYYYFVKAAINSSGYRESDYSSYDTGFCSLPITRIIRLEGELNFGNVQVGSTSQKTLTIFNDGNSTLTVYGIDYPAGFSGNWSGPISAGSYHNVTVTFSPIQPSTYSGNLTVNSDATSGDNTKSVSGTGGTSTSSPQVTTNNASNITSISAKLNGNLDDTGGLDCLIWFEYGTNTSYGSSTPKQSKSTTGPFNQTINGLNPNTTYHFRACASNTKGTDYGADKIFTTPMLGDFGSANSGSPDCIVDFEDLMIFALAYGSTPSDANWNPVCDIAGPGGPTPDGVIDFEDLMVFAMHYGETCADL